MKLGGENMKLHDKLDAINNQARVQRGHVEATTTEVVINLQTVDPARATVQLSGDVRAYMLSNDKLTVHLNAPCAINWEVRG